MIFLNYFFLVGAVSPTAGSAPYGHRRSLAALTGAYTIKLFAANSATVLPHPRSFLDY